MSTPMLMSWCPGGHCDPCGKPGPPGTIWISGFACIDERGNFGSPDCVLASGVGLQLIPPNPYAPVLLTFSETYIVSGAVVGTHGSISATFTGTTSGYYGSAALPGQLPLPWFPLPLQQLPGNFDLGYPYAQNDAGFFYPITLHSEVSGPAEWGPIPIEPNLYTAQADGQLYPIQYLRV